MEKVDGYGLRVTYRQVSKPEVFTIDIFGADKGQRMEDLIKDLPACDYCVVSVVFNEEPVI